MTKTPLIAAALLTAVAAPAVAAERTSFTHDGVTYSYTQTKVGESTILRGRATTGADFRYVVRNGQVVGKSNGIPVSFRVSDAIDQTRETTITLGN